ncbi:uncharacterized protein LOC118767950 [Octopus sinensis]|uniref:Uncharacterized protein LOC118767950 n=1 Tax=Octopus sinensis TaxID=2607531 RepID=A0A7E6FR45_9MOLL|nr:uncharacterized protein LOC118767950 [Octopus sinensis]
MWRFLAVLLMSFVLAIKGFYFHTELNPDRVIKAKAEVTPECLKYSENIDCRFYECLDKRYPCHKEHMGMENPYKHCKEDVAVAKTLNDVGKIWMDSIIKCFMTKMAEIYKAETIDCTTVVDKVKDIQRHCYISNDFCGVGWDNRHVLWKMFERKVTETKQEYYIQLWKNLGMMSSKCTSENAPKLTAWINAKTGQ